MRVNGWRWPKESSFFQVTIQEGGRVEKEAEVGSVGIQRADRAPANLVHGT